MKIAAVVVVFDPNIKDLIRNILTYIESVEKVLVVQNSLLDSFFCDMLAEYIAREKLIILGDGNNLGIATAMNIGVRWCFQKDITHVLTLDQDSYFNEGNFNVYKDSIVSNCDSSIGLYGVNPVCHGKSEFPQETLYLEVPDTISSGSVIPLRTFELCGLFKDKLFIDAVDYEFCYRIMEQKGLKTLIVTNAFMEHEVGYRRKTAFGFSTVNYSAFRSYYILRNQIAIWRKFPRRFQRKYKITLVKDHFFLRVAKILLAEDDKLAKITAIMTGIYHGIIGRSGYYKK